MLVSRGKDRNSAKCNASTKIEPDTVPDGSWGWFVVLACNMSHLLFGGFERSAGILFIELRNRYHGSAASTAWVFSLNTALRQTLGPVACLLSQRYGCRVVIMIGGVIFSLSVITCAVAPSIGVIILLWGVIGGWGIALTYSPTFIMVGAYFSKYRVLATGLGTAGVGIGTFIIPPLTQLFLDTYSYFGTMLLLGAIGLHFCICGALCRPINLHWKINRHRLNSAKLDEEENHWEHETLVSDDPVPRCSDGQHVINGHTKSNVAEIGDWTMTEEAQETEQIPAGKFHLETTTVNTELLIHENDVTISVNHMDVKDEDEDICKTDTQFIGPVLCNWCKTVIKSFDLGLLRNLPFLSFCLTIFLFSIAFQTGIVFLPALAQASGVSASESAWMLSVMGVMDCLGRVGGAGLTDLPRIRPYRPYIYNMVVVCTAVITLLCPLAHQLLGFMFIAGFYGFFSGIYISLKSVIIVDFLGIEHLSSSFGISICFQGFGSLIGPPISGVVRDTFGRFHEAFFLGGSLTLIAAMILFAGNLSYRQSLRTAARELHPNRLSMSHTS